MNWASLVLLAQTLSLKKGSLNTLFAPYFHLICPKPAKKKRKDTNMKMKTRLSNNISIYISIYQTILSFLGPEKILLPFTCEMT